MIPEERNTRGLRDAFSASIATMGDGIDCPAPDAIWESAWGHASPREDESVLLHVGGCQACAVAWRVARDLATEFPAREPGLGSRRGGISRWWPVSAAAVVALAMIGLGVRYLQTEPTSPVYRARDGAWLQSHVSETQPLPRDRCLLRWAPGPEGTTYQVRVTDERLDLLARGRGLAEPEFLVPEDALRGLPSGTVIVWQVTARLPGGAIVDSPGFLARVE